MSTEDSAPAPNGFSLHLAGVSTDLVEAFYRAERQALQGSDVVCAADEVLLQNTAEGLLSTWSVKELLELGVNGLRELCRSLVIRRGILGSALMRDYHGPSQVIRLAPVHGVFFIPTPEPLVEHIEQLMLKCLRRHWGHTQYLPSLRRAALTLSAPGKGLVLEESEVEPFIEAACHLLLADQHAIQCEALYNENMLKLQKDAVYAAVGINAVDLSRGTVAYLRPEDEVPDPPKKEVPSESRVGALADRFTRRFQ